MRRTRRPSSRLLVPLATAIALVAATPLSAAPQAGEPSDVEPPCVEPDPCDYVWEGAELGPFELARVEEVWVDSEDDDGTMLHGWLAFPDLPEGVRAPVALHSSPYLGFCSLTGECIPSPGQPAFWEDDPSPGVKGTWGVPPIELVRRGYVAAFFDVRGTGGSGGCMEWGGANETRDQKVLVDWLAEQPWSSGRVAMGGYSNPGTTPWQAAIQAPDGLKTIVTAGFVTDWYTWFHTPQGMQHTAHSSHVLRLESQSAWLPHAGTGVAAAGELLRIAERAAGCEPYAPAREAWEGAFLRDRDPGFWEPRRYQDRLNQVQASVLMAHGLRDIQAPEAQDMLVWEALQGTGPVPGPGRRPPGLPCPPHAPFCADAPKSPPTWQISGQWGHGPPFAPPPGAPAPEWMEENWHAILFDWLGYWLQGVGEAPPHRVDYQDTSGAWHTSSAWPPAEARDEALYLDGERLTSSPGTGDRRLLAATSPLGLRDHLAHVAGAGSPACRQELVPDGASETDVAYVSEPLASDSLLAGNPFAYLELSSDQPGGLVEVALLKWPADVSCLDVDIAEAVARGAVDLRHHAGNYRGTPFPVDTKTPVRVDLFNSAVRFAAGDRLVLVVSGPDTNFGHASFGVAPHAPEVTVHAGVSHVVVPFVSGGLGGQPSGIDYPPNPAAPGVPREQ